MELHQDRVRINKKGTHRLSRGVERIDASGRPIQFDLDTRHVIVKVDFSVHRAMKEGLPINEHVEAELTEISQRN